MALRDKLAERVQPFLQPGEQVRHVLMVRTGPSPWWMLLTNFMVFATKFYVIAVTDQAIVVAKAPWNRTTKPKELTARMPRAVAFGPMSGLWGGPIYVTPDGKRSWVHKRFQKDAIAADQELQASGTQPVAMAQEPGAVAKVMGPAPTTP